MASKNNFSILLNLNSYEGFSDAIKIVLAFKLTVEFSPRDKFASSSSVVLMSLVSLGSINFTRK